MNLTRNLVSDLAHRLDALQQHQATGRAVDPSQEQELEELVRLSKLLRSQQTPAFSREWLDRSKRRLLERFDARPTASRSAQCAGAADSL